MEQTPLPPLVSELRKVLETFIPEDVQFVHGVQRSDENNAFVNEVVAAVNKVCEADRAKTREVVQALVDALERVRREAEDIGTIVCNCGAPATGIQLAANTGIALAQSTLKIEPTKP